MNRFSQSTIENIDHYVYCLVDPRNNKIFYVGKGNGNRVFQHMEAALETTNETDKLDTIREIKRENKSVICFILRLGLSSEVAFEIEAAIIDLISFKDLCFHHSLTNLVSGHHSFNKGLADARK